MKNTKFKLTETTKVWCGITLYQIIALSSFGNVTKGDLGGWVEKEENVSVSGNAWIWGNASISGNARISGNASIWGNASISGDASISGNARISGDASISGNTWIWGDASISGNASIWGNARISGDASISGNTWIWGNARISGDASISGNARISGDASIWGNASISGDAKIENYRHLLHITNAKHNMTIILDFIQIGCKQFKSLKEAEKAVKEIGPDHGYDKDDQAFTIALLKLLYAEVERQNKLHPVEAVAKEELPA